jgi:hypothetical protein
MSERTGAHLAGAVALWAHRTPSVRAALLLGSRARSAEDPAVRPDAASDWDFQLIVTRPARFRSPRWTEDLGCGPPRACVVRKALWAGGLKVTVAFADAEADFMILPARTLRILDWLSALGCHRREGWTRRSLQGLIHWVRPSWRFLKDAGWVEPLYRRAAADLPELRLDDAAVRQLVAEFWCGHRWVLRQLVRGELVAAQRALHLELAEINLSLCHELSLRRGLSSFPGGRRLERFCPPGELDAVTVSAECRLPALRAAAAKASATCHGLAAALLAGDLSRHSGAEKTTNQHNEQPANSVM